MQSFLENKSFIKKLIIQSGFQHNSNNIHKCMSKLGLNKKEALGACHGGRENILFVNEKSKRHFLYLPKDVEWLLCEMF